MYDTTQPDPAAITPAAENSPARRFQLSSAFQPILSLPHRRIVGHEALLRAQDPQGKPVPPLHLFAGEDAAGQIALDEHAVALHLQNFAAQRQAAAAAELQGDIGPYTGGLPPLWLFVNMRPASFLRTLGTEGALAQALSELGALGAESPVVVEVTEEIVSRDLDFERCARQARELGCLLALDDFGAGHSNFDRVWRLQPEIVKLDRSLVQRGALDTKAARVIAQMVSLLHECGSLVLMEGVETLEEARLALDCDADLVQGYLFGKPQALLLRDADSGPQIEQVWQRFGLPTSRSQADRLLIAAHINALEQAAHALAAGAALVQACGSFLALPDSQLCVLLDEQGIQHGTSLMTVSTVGDGRRRFAPILDTEQACWARRPYFRRAREVPGVVQMTRPYLSIRDAHLCVTLSISLMIGGKPMVLCGDLAWTR